MNEWKECTLGDFVVVEIGKLHQKNQDFFNWDMPFIKLPDMQMLATETVLKQAELIANELINNN